MAASAIFIGSVKKGLAALVNADGTTPKSLLAAGATGSKVVSLIATSTDTAARVLQVYVTRSSTNYLLGSVPVPIGAGTDGATPAVDVLQAALSGAALIPGLARDNDGQPYLFLQSGDSLYIGVPVAVTTAKAINVHSDYGDF